MNLSLNANDISKLSSTARAEISALFFPRVDFDLPDGFDEDDFDGVIDVTLSQIEDFVDGCAELTVAGLECIAKYGPKITARKLRDVGIKSYGSFQGATTKRVRTVTGNADAYLLAWDDWNKHPEGYGHYAVTEKTFNALRSYFELD